MEGLGAAIKALPLDGWQVAEGPARIRSSIAELARFDLWGYSLKRSVQGSAYGYRSQSR